MSAANGFTVDNLEKYSPSRLAIPDHLPPVLLIHGASDPVTDPQYTIDFHNYLKNNGNGCRLGIVQGTGHQEVVTYTSLGKGDVQAVICDWIESTFNL